MFALRFIGLAFAALIGWQMGHIPSGELNFIGALMAGSFLFSGPALYMLPTYEAWLKKHPNLGSITLVNLFLGWSLLGWVIAVVWAFKRQEPVTMVVDPATPPPHDGSKTCPFCAEKVRVEAIKCKHCGSSLLPVAEGSAE